MQTQDRPLLGDGNEINEAKMYDSERQSGQTRISHTAKDDQCDRHSTANQHRIVVEVSQSRYMSVSAHCSNIVASSRNDCIATLLETKLNKQAIGMGVQDVRKCNGSKE